ncbi:MAG: YicC family protein [Gammaproteobacteria bacterium]|nr:YicC family protein [Gammaproteobacteria bacterium]
MIHSMTAFARRDSETAEGALVWELRSVNHRFLEVSLRLPENLRGLESLARERIAARLQRGKVDGHLRFQTAPQEAAGLVLNRALVERLIGMSRAVDNMLLNPAPLNAFDILRWPGVLEAEEADLEPVQAAALALLEKTVEELAAARAREGEKLARIIAQRCDAMAALVQRVRGRLPEISQRLRERLIARFAELKAELDPVRLEQEMVILAQKMDVDEEMERLASHLDEVRRTLLQGGPAGRRLDFLMQELNREASTLGAKSADVETTRASMDMKVLIEQMREQVQNIE